MIDKEKNLMCRREIRNKYRAESVVMIQFINGSLEHLKAFVFLGRKTKWTGGNYVQV